MQEAISGGVIDPNSIIKLSNGLNLVFYFCLATRYASSTTYNRITLHAFMHMVFGHSKLATEWSREDVVPLTSEQRASFAMLTR